MASHVLSLRTETTRPIPGSADALRANPEDSPPGVHARKVSGGTGVVWGWTCRRGSARERTAADPCPWSWSVRTAPNTKPAEAAANTRGSRPILTGHVPSRFGATSRWLGGPTAGDPAPRPRDTRRLVTTRARLGPA